MLVGVRVRMWGALAIVAGCSEPQSGLPSQAVKDDLQVETRADARQRRSHPTPAGDVKILCDAATGIDAAAPDAVRQWTQRVEKLLMMPRTLELVGLLPTLAPAAKWTVIRNGAGELGVPDWSCPALEAIFAAEAKANPEPAPRQPLRFALGAREFTGVSASATQFNKARRIIVSSQATTCEELLAVPEKPKKGRVTLVVTAPWTSGTHPVATAEVIDDDTRAVTVIEASDGTVTIGDEVDGRRAVTLAIKGQAGSASGTIDVAPCD